VLIDREYCLSRGIELYAAGGSDEDILKFLRGEQASMMDSVVLIRKIKNIPLKDAQRIVHQSATWADEKESHEHLQDVFLTSLEELTGGKEISPGKVVGQTKSWLKNIFRKK
jgi:hypothetical protein